jgi:Fic family protein
MPSADAPTHFKWSPIKNFDEDPKSLTDGELVSMKRVWDRESSRLDPKALADFHTRLKREWSIETGIVENIYALDRSVIRNLIDTGIDATLIPHDSVNRSPEAAARMIQDHIDVLEEMSNGQNRELTVGYIQELHAALLRNQDSYTAQDAQGKLVELALEKGVYKNAPNSPTRSDGSVQEYCPPEHVESEMQQLIEFHAGHRASGVPVEVVAAWLQHRFTQIHPFADGNGRVGRAIASFVFIQAGLFPVLITRDNLAVYLEALENADAGSLRPLVNLLVDGQRMAVIQATETNPGPDSTESADEAIAAVRSRLDEKRQNRAEWETAKATANHLADLASVRLEELADKLFEDLDSEARGDRFDRVPGQEVDVDHVLSAIGVSGDLQEHDRSFSLVLDTGKQDWIHISFYALGPKFHGLIGVIAHLELAGESAPRVAAERFLVNYEEAKEDASVRFANWLERGLIHLLDEWRRLL